MNNMSICPVCQKKLTVKRYREGDKVYDLKTCPSHGTFKTLIWQGDPDYEDWNTACTNSKPLYANTPVEKGCPFDCGLCADHKQAACCVLIEITKRCNQHCPYCFAQSIGENQITDGEPTLKEIQDIYDFLLEQSSKRPFNIQLSGGEPTMRQDLPRIITMGREKGFPYIQLNTNGRKMGEDRSYVKELKKAGLSSVFLQFDGITDDIYKLTRGEALLDIKKRAINYCIEEGLSVVFVMTVVPKVNYHCVGEVIDFALENRPYIRGVHFQPVSYFGRYPKPPKDEDRITIPQLIRAIEDQTQGRINRKAFVPLMTGHPLCSFHGSFKVGQDGSLRALSDDQVNSEGCSCCGQAPIDRARDYISSKWVYDKTCAESKYPEWDRILRELKESSFSITAMAFQDAWNLDLERLKRCRVHVAVKDLKLIPFCAYNIIYRK